MLESARLCPWVLPQQALASKLHSPYVVRQVGQDGRLVGGASRDRRLAFRVSSLGKGN